MPPLTPGSTELAEVRPLSLKGRGEQEFGAKSQSFLVRCAFCLPRLSPRARRGRGARTSASSVEPGVRGRRSQTPSTLLKKLSTSQKFRLCPAVNDGWARY